MLDRPFALVALAVVISVCVRWADQLPTYICGVLFALIVGCQYESVFPLVLAQVIFTTFLTVLLFLVTVSRIFVVTVFLPSLLTVYGGNPRYCFALGLLVCMTTNGGLWGIPYFLGIVCVVEGVVWLYNPVKDDRKKKKDHVKVWTSILRALNFNLEFMASCMHAYLVNIHPGFHMLEVFLSHVIDKMAYLMDQVVKVFVYPYKECHDWACEWQRDFFTQGRDRFNANRSKHRPSPEARRQQREDARKRWPSGVRFPDPWMIKSEAEWSHERVLEAISKLLNPFTQAVLDHVPEETSSVQFGGPGSVMHVINAMDPRDVHPDTLPPLFPKAATPMVPPVTPPVTPPATHTDDPRLALLAPEQILPPVAAPAHEPSLPEQTQSESSLVVYAFDKSSYRSPAALVPSPPSSPPSSSPSPIAFTYGRSNKEKNTRSVPLPGPFYAVLKPVCPPRNKAARTKKVRFALDRLAQGSEVDRDERDRLDRMVVDADEYLVENEYGQLKRVDEPEDEGILQLASRYARLAIGSANDDDNMALDGSGPALSWIIGTKPFVPETFGRVSTRARRARFAAAVANLPRQLAQRVVPSPDISMVSAPSYCAPVAPMANPFATYQPVKPAAPVCSDIAMVSAPPVSAPSISVPSVSAPQPVRRTAPVIPIITFGTPAASVAPSVPAGPSSIRIPMVSAREPTPAPLPKAPTVSSAAPPPPASVAPRAPAVTAPTFSMPPPPAPIKAPSAVSTPPVTTVASSASPLPSLRPSLKRPGSPFAEPSVPAAPVKKETFNFAAKPAPTSSSFKFAASVAPSAVPTFNFGGASTGAPSQQSGSVTPAQSLPPPQPSTFDFAAQVTAQRSVFNFSAPSMPTAQQPASVAPAPSQPPAKQFSFNFASLTGPQTSSQVPGAVSAPTSNIFTFTGRPDTPPAFTQTELTALNQPVDQALEDELVKQFLELEKSNPESVVDPSRFLTQEENEDNSCLTDDAIIDLDGNRVPSNKAVSAQAQPTGNSSTVAPVTRPKPTAQLRPVSQPFEMEDEVDYEGPSDDETDYKKPPVEPKGKQSEQRCNLPNPPPPSEPESSGPKFNRQDLDDLDVALGIGHIPVIPSSYADDPEDVARAQLRGRDPNPRPTKR
ncbi:hypothetical protein F5Y08DRAFT_335797 [Xylaria arbuscula]|nr:hypothetical protein F5Y08DRAFT_335797 [Xylaria arbuscula]